MELWGMTGLYLLAFAVGGIFVANYIIKKPFLKFMSKPTLLLIGAGLIILAGSSCAYWGLTTAAAPGVPAAAVTPGATFEAEGSESLENTTYDYATRTFTTHYYENVGTAQAEYHAALDDVRSPDALIPVVVTITVYRTDSLVLVENAGARAWAVVDEFYGINENAGIRYACIDKDTSSQKYEVALAPAGITARDEAVNFSVAASGSRAITVTMDPYHLGLSQLDNYDSTDVKIYITGVEGYFTHRFVKIGETT